MTTETSNSEKVQALWVVATYRPVLTAGVITLSLVAAILEGVGLSFIVPIIEQTKSGGPPASEADGLLGLFARSYEFLGVPFELEYVLLGVIAVMTIRFTASFTVAFLRSVLQTDYIRHLQTRLFENSLDARIGYFDRRGSDEILNAIVTQTTYAGNSISIIVKIVQEGLISLVYFSVAMYLAPVLTVVSGVVLGGAVYLIRGGLESGYDVGDRVAEANQRVQEIVQSGVQGIRDVKLFGLDEELTDDFRDAVDMYADSTITLRRNEAAISNFYQLIIAVTVFSLIYFAVSFASLSLGGLGVFLFAMFRLGPRLSTLNDYFYSAEGKLPHLVRTQEYIAELEANEEPDSSAETLPETVDCVRFDDVDFTYQQGEQVIDGLSFSVERGEFIAFVGPSGVGKSTIVSLLTRMYDPESGRITADRVPISQVAIGEWRSRVSVVRQNPYIFDDTLRYNVTIGNRNVSEAELKRACEIAQVSEFLDKLPKGYDTELGDDGVRLSGGQRQRIAIARALVEDADLIVLDEATSDLDTTLEERVHAGIEGMERDYAMIVIAHRLSTVTNANRIYTMEKGQVVERGTHEQLLENDGHYASLYAVQT
ncbi:ABC transporter ATP-binding protein [Haladaptatus sp. NG-SE-30]